jgi:regulator of protease activity HflC (stomatin/prohibitin superfamily)
MQHHPRIIPTLVFLLAALPSGPTTTRAADDYVPFEGEKTTWHDGFDRFDFVMDEASLDITPFRRPGDEGTGVGVPGKDRRSCIVVAPRRPAPGNPWSWRGQYWDHEPQAEIELLRRGFHRSRARCWPTACPEVQAVSPLVRGPTDGTPSGVARRRSRIPIAPRRQSRAPGGEYTRETGPIRRPPRRRSPAMDENWESTTKPTQVMREILVTPKPGLGMLALSLGGLLGGGLLLLAGAGVGSPLLILLGVAAGILGIFGLTGLFTVGPNEAKVLQLFGNYQGTVREPGLRWVNPFYTKRGLSLRVRNFESERLKVNDLAGNPIEIAAVVVWRVVDTAEALFHVDSYDNFVHVQSESALRNMAMSYPYDAHAEGEASLRSHTAEIAEHLKAEIQERLAQAGVEVLEARISHLAYAPEIAHAMLQRQQASAVIAARQKIVEGAVGMVEMALEMLSHQHIVELDNEKKATMVSNLLVVLCSDRGTQPIVSAGRSG